MRTFRSLLILSSLVCGNLVTADEHDARLLMKDHNQINVYEMAAIDLDQMAALVATTPTGTTGPSTSTTIITRTITTTESISTVGSVSSVLGPFTALGAVSLAGGTGSFVGTLAASGIVVRPVTETSPGLLKDALEQHQASMTTKPVSTTITGALTLPSDIFFTGAYAGEGTFVYSGTIESTVLKITVLTTEATVVTYTGTITETLLETFSGTIDGSGEGVLVGTISASGVVATGTECGEGLASTSVDFSTSGTITIPPCFHFEGEVFLDAVITYTGTIEATGQITPVNPTTTSTSTSSPTVSICPIQSPGGKLIVVETPANRCEAERICQSMDMRLAEINIFNFGEATELLFGCEGAYSSAWIGEWNWDDYRGTCLALTVSHAVPGGAINNPGDCDLELPFICGNARARPPTPCNLLKNMRSDD